MTFQISNQGVLIRHLIGIVLKAISALLRPCPVLAMYILGSIRQSMVAGHKMEAPVIKPKKPVMMRNLFLQMCFCTFDKIN